MLNIEKGELRLNDYVLSPEVNRHDFIKSVLYTEYLQDERHTNSSFWYFIKPIKLNEDNVSFSLCFYNDILIETNMCFHIGSNSEINRKEYHDQWLMNQIGEPPYLYNWGIMVSVYDEQNDFSYIKIKYRQSTT